MKLSSIFIISAMLISAAGILIYVPSVAQTKTKEKRFLQTSREDFEKGVFKNVQIKDYGENAYLTLQTDDSNADGQDSDLGTTSDVIMPQISEMRVLGGDLPIEPPSPKEIDVSPKFLKGKNSTSRSLKAQERPDQISFFLWVSHPTQNNEVSFMDSEGREGPVLTTEVTTGLTGPLMAEDGDQGVQITSMAMKDWVEIRLEDIDYEDGTFDIKVKKGWRRRSYLPEWDVEKSNLPFKEDIDHISRVDYDVPDEVTMAWVPPRMKKFQYEEISSDGTGTTAQSDSSSTGTFESSVLDSYSGVENRETIQNIKYNQINWCGDKLDKVKIQIAHSSNSSDWSDFVGPDGTTSSYYSIKEDSKTEVSSAVNDHDDYRYLKYKVYFESGSEESPRLDNIMITYTLSKPDSSGGETDYVTYRVNDGSS